MSGAISTSTPSSTDPISHDVRGSNQSGLRAHNERLVLSLVRRHGALAKADIARRTGLSAQTVSVIMRQLEAEGLLVKGDPVRGKVGQPLVPMRLAPEGAYFFGLKVGRRSTELLLINFLGTVVDRLMETHDFPTPDSTVAFAERGLRQLTEALPKPARARIAGIGIAMPFQIWDWAHVIGLDPARMDEWRHRDIRADIARLIDSPVFLQNDATSACGAELAFGRHGGLRNFLYFYIGYFVGGGVVINGSLYTGPSGNAGAIGSTPVPGPSGLVQLIDVASLSGLERLAQAKGHDTENMWVSPSGWHLPQTALDTWMEGAAAGIAHAIACAIAVIDFECILIDGWISPEMRTRLAHDAEAALSRLDLSGLTLPDITTGSVGPDARALGAASLPLSKRFLLDGTTSLSVA